MKSKARFKSDAFEAIHSAAKGLHRAGTIDKATMREFDESCLTAPSEIPPEEIKRIREGRGMISVITQSDRCARVPLVHFFFWLFVAGSGMSESPIKSAAMARMS